MEDCIFCRIVKGEIPSYKIGESEKFLAFLDLSQITEGHTLVIPKEHNQFIWDVPNIGKYFEFVKKIGNHYRDIGFKYVDTLTLGRQVPHSHVHLIPHNGNESDWKKSLKSIEEIQSDRDRWLEKGKMESIAQKFQLD